MKRFMLAAVAVLALALPGAALGKEATALEICGPDGCKTVTDRTVLSQLQDSAGGYEISVGPAAPAEYYRLRTTIDGGEGHTFTFESFYVPSGRVIRSVDEHRRAQWRRTPPAERELLAALVAGVRPFAVPQVTRATVGRRPAADPASYLGLYRLKQTRSAYPRKADWLRIRVYSSVPSPWTDGANVLRYSPSGRLLERDGTYVRLSKRLGASVRRAAALRVPGGGSPGRSGVLLALTPAVLAAALLVRSRTK